MFTFTLQSYSRTKTSKWEEQQQLAEETEPLYDPVYGFQQNPRYKRKPTRAFRDFIDLNPAPKQYETRWFRCPFCFHVWSRSSEDVPYSKKLTECSHCTSSVKID